MVYRYTVVWRVSFPLATLQKRGALDFEILKQLKHALNFEKRAFLLLRLNLLKHIAEIKNR